MSGLTRKAKQALGEARSNQAQWRDDRLEDFAKPVIIQRASTYLEVEPEQIENLKVVKTPDLHTSHWAFDCDGLPFMVKFKMFGRVGLIPGDDGLKVGECYIYLVHRYVIDRIFGGIRLEDRIVRSENGYGGAIFNLVDLGARLEQIGG